MDDSLGVIPNGWIRIEGTRIAALGDGEAPADENTIDCGFCLVPGFIDAHTHLGISENGLAFEGDDINEDSEPSTPHMRALDAINQFDLCFTEALQVGVTTVAVAPGSANPVGGQICVMKTFGRRVDDMLLMAPAAIKFALGENPKTTYHGKNLAPLTRMATAAIIRETLAKAKHYSDDIVRAENDDDFDEPEYDIRCESLLELMQGRIPAHFHAHRADDIFTAIRIANEFGLDYVIIHATDGHLIAPELAELHAKVVVGPNLCDRSKPELLNLSYDNPRILNASGLDIAITTDHPVIPINYLPLAASLAIKNGLPASDALAAITRNPAKILGIYDRVGSLAPGKDADFVLIDGEPLAFDSKVRAVFVDGKQVYQGKIES